MLNLYEILEVSEKASKEVIEKAYRVLAKKYHPDLQEEPQKQEAESKMKQINAYDILSNEEKRKQYDIELEQERQEEKRNEQQYKNTQMKNDEQEKQYNIYTHNQETMQSQTNGQKSPSQTEYENKQAQIEYEKRMKKMEYENQQKIQNEMNKAYNDAYYTYLRRLRL